MSKVHFGLCNVYIAKRVASGGSVSYDTPVRVPGAVSLNRTKRSEASDFFADNILYFKGKKDSGEDLELVLADVPRSILLQYLNYLEANEGGIVSTDKIPDTAFALLFQVETDDKARKFCYFNCTASEGDGENKTTETANEPQTDTLKIACAGEESGDYQIFKHVVESTDQNYATFFSSVTIPTVSE